jgi:hypothetical protein
MEASSQQVHEEKKFKKTQSCNIIRSPNQNTKLYRISNYLFGVIKVVDNENRTRIRTSNYNIVFGTKLEPPTPPKSEWTDGPNDFGFGWVRFSFCFVSVQSSHPLCVWMSFQVIFQSSHRSCIVLHLASLILCGSDSFCFEILKERRWLAGAGSVLPLSPLFSLLRPSAGHVFVATGRAPLLLRRRYAGHTQLALHTQVGVGPVVDSPVGTDDRARTQSAGRVCVL